MRRAVVVVSLLALLGACKKPPPEDPCRPPTLGAAAAGTYAGEKQAALNCVKQAAFVLVKAGGPTAPIAAAAVAQCADAEKAIGKSGATLYDWQRALLHEDLLHTAQRAAVQARATGCGLPPGVLPQDTL